MAMFVFTLLMSAMLASIFWLQLSKRIGKFYAWQTFNFVNAATNLVFFAIGEGDAWYIVAAGALNGIPVGGQFLVNTIMSDVIDYDEFLNGARCEAAFSVFATLIPKFVAIPASAVPLAIINLLGFRQPVDGVAQPQNEHVHLFIKVAFVMVPFTCAVLSFLVKFRYPIKNDVVAKGVQAGIDQYKQGERKVRARIVSDYEHASRRPCSQRGKLASVGVARSGTPCRSQRASQHAPVYTRRAESKMLRCRAHSGHSTCYICAVPPVHDRSLQWSQQHCRRTTRSSTQMSSSASSALKTTSRRC